MKDELDWTEFSSDESIDGDARVGRQPKAAAKKRNLETKAKSLPVARGQGNKENSQRGKTNGKKDYKVPRKAKVNNVKKSNSAAVDRFGADAIHKFKGKYFAPSPLGPMVLSRRLSRKIMKASPLRSPM